jgi:hypothetical protein
MDPAFPSDSELAVLARQVDEQLNALQSAPAAYIRFRGVAPGERAELPAAPDQQAVIERAAGEPFEAFWQKFKRQLRRDLCLPDGLLYKQWHTWKDLQSKDAVKVAYGVIAGMGIPTASLAPAAVAATVFLLNVLLKAGIEAVCEGCAEEEAGRDEARKQATGEKSNPH